MIRKDSANVSYLLTASLFLVAAFASKYYTGPAHSIAEAYVGDFFIVGVLYYTLSAAAKAWPPSKRFAAVALFASAVEGFQATGLPASWNLSRPLSFVFGVQFDGYDVLSYLAGLIFARLVEHLLLKKTNAQVVR